MALVETDRAGVTVHSKEEKMGVRGSPTQQVSFDDVRVPLESLLGVERWMAGGLALGRSRWV